MEQKQGKQNRFSTKTCTRVQVRVLKFEKEQCVFTFDDYVTRDRIHCRFGSFTSYDNSLIPGEKETIQKLKKDPLIIVTSFECPQKRKSARLSFGHVCPSSIIEKITRVTFHSKISRRKGLFVPIVSRSVIISYQE